MTVAPTFTSLIACNIVYGIADGFFFTCVNCLVLTVSPMKTAAVLGWEMMITSIFVASGPPLAGKTVVVNSPLSHGGHIVPGDQKSFVLPR